MDLKLSDIWTATGVLVGFQVAAFSWRVSREIAVADRGDINWLPPADIMNLVSMLVAIMGVFVLPTLGLSDVAAPRLAFTLSIILFAGYPFAVAGHYDLFVKGPRSYKYAPRQEKVAVFVTSAIALVFLIMALSRVGLL